MTRRVKCCVRMRARFCYLWITCCKLLAVSINDCFYFCWISDNFLLAADFVLLNMSVVFIVNIKVFYYFRRAVLRVIAWHTICCGKRLNLRFALKPTVKETVSCYAAYFNLLDKIKKKIIFFRSAKQDACCLRCYIKVSALQVSLSIMK